jgi:hypothetical protein
MRVVAEPVSGDVTSGIVKVDATCTIGSGFFAGRARAHKDADAGTIPSGPGCTTTFDDWADVPNSLALRA